MTTSKTMAIAGCILLTLAVMPLATAHLTSRSDTSFGWGGLADPDPCRWGDVPGPGTGACADVPGNVNKDLNPAGSTDPDVAGTVHSPGVSGVYLGHGVVTLVECTNATTITTGDCDGNIFTNTGWGATGAILCDLEVIAGPGLGGDEEIVDNSIAGGITPDGTWDDGGFGGACHTVVYNAGTANNASKVPDHPIYDADEDDEMCHSDLQAYAEDWVLGADVPLLATCDVGQTAAGNPCLVNAVITNIGMPGNIPGAIVTCIQQALQFNPSGDLITCAPDGTADVSNLGKGGGHGPSWNGHPGVPYPTHQTFLDDHNGVHTHDCQSGSTNPHPLTNPDTDPTPGMPAVFIGTLVSANVFGDDVDDGGDNAGPNNPDDPHNHGDDDDSHSSKFGTDHDDFAWPGIGGGELAHGTPLTGGGTGDTIVYAATGGWIDSRPDPKTQSGFSCTSLDGSFLCTGITPDGCVTAWIDSEADGDDTDDGTEQVLRKDCP